MFSHGLGYKPALKRTVEHFGKKDIRKILPLEIKEFLYSFIKQGFSHKTTRNNKSVLKQVFDIAIVEMNYKINNPCDKIRLMSNEPKTKRTPITEMQRKEIESTKSSEFLLAFLILYTGTRCGEALALQMKDVDFDADVISINKAAHFKGNMPYLGKLKTATSYRQVPLLKPLKDMLLRLNRAPDDYIVCGSELITQCRLRRQWEKFCRDHGMARKEKIQPTENNTHTFLWKPEIDRHSIRHEYETTMYEAGVEDKSIQGY